jgi:hypothetical protein
VLSNSIVVISPFFDIDIYVGAAVENYLSPDIHAVTAVEDLICTFCQACLANSEGCVIPDQLPTEEGQC